MRSVATSAVLVPTITPGSSEASTLRVGVLVSEQAGYAALRQRFVQEFPTIQIELVVLDDIITATNREFFRPNTVTLQAILSKVDVASSVFAVPEMLTSHYLLDLSPYADADANRPRADYDQGTLSAWMTNQQLWVLPHYVSLSAISYNTTFFTNTALQPPHAGWSWDGLLTLAEAAAQQPGAIPAYGFAEASNGVLPILGLVEESGLKLTQLPASVALLRAPQVQAAITRVRALLLNRGLLMAYPLREVEGLPDREAAELIAEGRVAMWADVITNRSSGALASLADIPPGHVPFPEGPGSLPYPLPHLFGTASSVGYLVSRATLYPNAAWQWIEWLTRQPLPPPNDEVQTLLHRLQIPARHSLAASTTFWERLPTEATTAYKTMLARQPTITSDPTSYLTVDAITQIINALLADPAMTVEQATSAAETDLANKLTALALTPTPLPIVLIEPAATPGK